MATVQRIIAALNPNTNYVFKVRSVNGLGITSEWSESVLVTTPAITAAPTGILIQDLNDGHTYRIISTNGALSVVLVT